MTIMLIYVMFLGLGVFAGAGVAFLCKRHRINHGTKPIYPEWTVQGQWKLP